MKNDENPNPSFHPTPPKLQDSFSLEIPKYSQGRNNLNRNMLLKFLGSYLPSWQAAQLPPVGETQNPGNNTPGETGRPEEG